MPKKVFLWDIDGTILLTGGAGIAAFDRVFLELFGQKYIWKNLQPDGRTDPWIIDQLYKNQFNKLPSQKIRKEIIIRYNQALKKELPLSQNFRLMPYAKETLEILSQREDVSLGLATGNFEEAAWNKLKHAGLDHHFAYGGFGTDSHDRQILTQLALDRAIKHIGGTPKEVYVVGDTIYDIRCARGIGAKSITVCTGSTSRKMLEAEKADWVLDNLQGFEEIFLN